MRILINNISSTNPAMLVKWINRIDKLDIDLWGSDCAAPGEIAASNMVSNYFQAPNTTDHESYLSFLQKVSKSADIDLILTCTDAEVRFMSQYADKLSVKTVIAETRAINTFSDKLTASLEMESIGISVPTILKNLFGAQKVIFRKRCSVCSLGIYIVDLSQEKFIENHFQSDWFVQPFIEGDIITCDVLADSSGIPQLIIPRKKLQVMSGSAFRSQLIHHEGAIEACKRILQHYFIPGFSDFEFIDTGDKLYFIEGNLRFSGSASEGITASFNYIEHFLRHFVFGEPMKGIDYYMQYVIWDSIVSRYFEEIAYPKIDHLVSHNANMTER